MKRNNSLLRLLTISIMLLFTTTAFAQFGDLGKVLSTGADDAEKIFEAYLSPYANGMAAGLSAGWYNTAKAHKLGGFDLTVSFNATFIPSSAKSYDANDLNLGDPNNPDLRVDIVSGNSPTAAGSKDPGQQVSYYQENVPVLEDVLMTQLDLPQGTGFAYTAMPVVQLGVGLVKETDLQFRYSPDIEWGNGSKMGLWGVGLKHSIKQWIPALNKIPIFDLSVQGGYSSLKMTSGLNFQPSDYNSMGIIKPGDIVLESPGYYDDQELLLDISNITANIIFSGDFKIICLYGGVGISSSTTNLQLNGNYPFPDIDPGSGQIRIDETTALSDPIDISIKSTDGSATKPRFNAGFRLKFAVVTLNFDYTYANYSIASAGLGVSFR